MNEKTKLTGLLVGSLAALSTFAQTSAIPTPPAPEFADTESSTSLSLSGWDELTREFHLALELTPTISNNVELAIGVNGNDNAILDPEETALVLGCDRGTWFVRDERYEGEGTRYEGEGTRSMTFDLTPIFDRNWNMIRVTTRGTDAANAYVVFDLKNHPFKIAIR